MTLSSPVIEHAEQLLREALRFAQPADALVSQYFRQNRAIGQRDRGVIAEAVYTVLRHKLEFAQFAQSGSGSLERRLVLLGLAYGVGMPAVIAASEPVQGRWLEHIATVDRASLPFEIRSNLPAWLIERLRQRFDAPTLERLANSLNRPAPLDLRVNALKATREEVLEKLIRAGYEAKPTSHAPLGIRLDTKLALANMELFLSGQIEVQDEGSQLLSHLLAPRRGELVIDFCAGAGGKTLALGALMRSTGRLYAYDVSARRLAKLKPRLARSGLSNVHPVAIDSERDSRLKRMAHKADRVLIDAPCSGLGTLRRNPDLKWRQTPESIGELCVKQAAILGAAARLVKPGGSLVYATCSLLAEENAAIVEAFLGEHAEFEIQDAGAALRDQGIAIETGQFLELWPHVHATDGFFAALLRRRT